MRLTRPQRVVWVIFGLGSISGGVTVGIMSALGAGLGLIIPGFLIFICGSLGKVPNMNLKEGSVDFKNIEEPKPVKSVEDLRPEIEKLRTELERTSRRLEDYILAHGPAPDDDLTDEERLPALYRACQELQEEMDRRMKSGEDHGDGLDAEHFRKLHVKADDALVKEERRQWAQFEFGLRTTQPKSIYDN